MVMSRVFFSDLKSGRCSSTVEVRLLQFWEARNPRRGGELMWIDMLMVDVNKKLFHSFSSNESVTLSLFDAEAVAFHHRLDNMCIDPKVIVATAINPKMVGGHLYLNATSGTHLYFDKETSPGDLVARDTGLPPVAPSLKGYAKVETLTITELNTFIITAPSQAIDFLCTGEVRRVESEKGWCYVACSKCSKKLQRTVNSFTCERCVNSHAVGSLRYRVEMAIADDTAEGMFVCFDGVMTKLHGLKASEAGQMLAGDGVNPEDTNVPPFISEMEGKTYTFQVRVSEYNFRVNHQTFTITRILKNDDRHPVPDFVENGGDSDDGNDGAGGKQISANPGDCGGRLGDTIAVVSSPPGDTPDDYPSSSSTVGKKARLE
ncbi:unnamed protein product [Eruca vesicaria subsp. sativa]|uniref:Replication factor A C-terminal domain-containing protein n=1 Tax=Eruca vesicaria subsp. sativa TaxID=29727 RepID=A0ABC8KVG2_ERUVS|nr:unnamed protein product [Eruca vesicaria subsp. sativa]